MSKSKQLVRFTFWMNNLMILLLLLVVLALTSNLVPSIIGKISIVFIFIFSILARWYRQQRFAVKGFMSFDNYDEREQHIALKVNSTLLSFLLFGIFLLLILLFPLMSWISNVYTLGLIIILTLLVFVLCVNLLYFYLWYHYDSE
jgi:hypothetical protein